jgi:hypothetical protein
LLLLDGYAAGGAWAPALGRPSDLSRIVDPAHISFRPEIVSAGTENTIQFSAYRSAERQNVLHAVEAALTKARMDAEAIANPVLAYFIHMAIAELNNCHRPN